MNPIIREATVADIPAILEITREAFEKYAKDAKVPGNLSALSETMKKFLRIYKTKPYS